MNDHDGQSRSPLHVFHDEPPEPPSDLLEKWFHGVLGFLLGGATGFFHSLWRGTDGWLFVLTTLGTAAGCAWAAACWGGRFWNWVFGRRV